MTSASQSIPLAVIVLRGGCITLPPGTTLFLYTDGLDEAENAERQMFGKERINEVLQTTSPDPQTLIRQMTQAVADFVGDTEQSDDLTMLALQYL